MTCNLCPGSRWNIQHSSSTFQPAGHFLSHVISLVPLGTLFRIRRAWITACPCKPPHLDTASPSAGKAPSGHIFLLNYICPQQPGQKEASDLGGRGWGRAATCPGEEQPAVSLPARGMGGRFWSLHSGQSGPRTPRCLWLRLHLRACPSVTGKTQSPSRTLQGSSPSCNG